MNRLESWMMHISTILLTVTGLLYAWMRYLMEPVDPFSVVNHPWEPYMLHIHILAAPVLVLGFGIIFHGHILFKKAAGSRTAKRSGLILIPTFTIMVLSGYLLQVVTSDFRKALVGIHLVSGGFWALFYIGHQLASLAQRRARGNGNRFRVPVQVLLISFLLIAAKSEADPFERQVSSMGTTLRVLMMEANRDLALRNSETLIRTVEQTDQQLSTWKNNSELTRLNQALVGKPFEVSPELFFLLRRIEEFTRWTDRSFDAGIGRLIDVWDVHGSFRIPSAQEISSALERSGFDSLRFDDKHFTVTKVKDVRIDPGAFGKGEALDRAMDVAKELKMSPLLIDFGGQIAVHGFPENEAGWSTALSLPENRSKLAGERLFLRSGSLSTSGYSERSAKIHRRMVHHILNPQTGEPAKPFGSVTVWNSSALIADVLSTALYVMGPEAGYKWAVQNKIAAAFVTNGGQVKRTPEFERLFSARTAR